MKKSNLVFLALLMLGVVDQIDGNTALISYEQGGAIKHTYVSLDMSACTPREGQKVYFYEGYKIVTCEE